MIKLLDADIVDLAVKLSTPVATLKEAIGRLGKMLFAAKCVAGAGVLALLLALLGVFTFNGWFFAGAFASLLIAAGAAIAAFVQFGSMSRMLPLGAIKKLLQELRRLRTADAA